MPFRTGLFRPAAVATSDLLAVAAVATPDAAAAEASTVLDVLETAGGRRNACWNQQNPPADSRAMGVWPRTRGEGEVVAVLDMASHIQHEDLIGAVLPDIDLTGRSTGDPWHGYGVAGIVAARADHGIGIAGMAPATKVLPVRGCANDGCTSAAVSLRPRSSS